MINVRYFCLIITLLTLSVNSFGEATKIAMPRDYNDIANELIGTREGGYGVDNGTAVNGLVVNSIEGKPFSLDELWREKPAMVIFYRGGWCPFCNAQIRELSLAYPEFEKRGVEIAVISVDKPDASSLLKKTYEVPFHVLSDQDLVAHKAFNVVLEISAEKAKKAKETFGLDFKEWSEREHLAIAVASSFLVDTEGKVTWSTVIKDYRSRPSVEQLLSAIEM